MNIFVGNLSFKTTEEELQKEFDAFGEVDSVKIIMDQYTHKSRGFAFVEMPNQEQAQAAIAGLNGKELAGQTLTVNEAKPRESRGGQGRGRSGGGFGSGGRPGGGGPRPGGRGGSGSGGRSGGGGRRF
jgi:cold-inducible RNA-binding protein